MCVCVCVCACMCGGGGVEVGYLLMVTPGNAVNAAAKANSCSFEHVKCVSVLKGSSLASSL